MGGRAPAGVGPGKAKGTEKMFTQSSSVLTPGNWQGFALHHGAGRCHSSSISAFLDDTEDVRSSKAFDRLEGAGGRRRSSLGDLESALARLGIACSQGKSPELSAITTPPRGSVSATDGAHMERQKGGRLPRGPQGRSLVGWRKSPPPRGHLRGRATATTRSVTSHRAVGKTGGTIPPHSTTLMARRNQSQQQRIRSVRQSTAGRAVSGGSTATAPSVGERGSSAARKGREAPPTASAPAVARKRKSYIESINVGDGDPWQPPSGETPGKRKASDGIPVMQPLPRHTIRQLYAEDVAPFEKRSPSLTESAPLPTQLSVRALESTLNCAHGLDASSGVTAPSVPLSCVEGVHDPSLLTAPKSVAVPSLHAWAPPPSNVLLPDGMMQQQQKQQKQQQQGDAARREVWRLSSPAVGDGSDANEWMLPLQEIPPSKKKSANAAGTRKSFAPVKDDNEIDYHVLFSDMRCKKSCQRAAEPLTEKNARASPAAAAGEVNGLANSMAACSALLREPQQLLDSEFLVPGNAASSLSASRPRNVNRWMTVFNSGTTRTSLFQPTVQRFTFVELSHPAKVLYAAVLYLRTLGGFPTLLRINPLTENSSVVGKEHCVELVFAARDEGREKESPTLSRVTFNAARPRRLSVTRGATAAWPSGTTEAEERVVVVRSILAEKSVVERFGGREVVHVLPPLQSTTSTLDAMASSRGSAQMMSSRSDAVQRLLLNKDMTFRSSTGSQMRLPMSLQRGSGSRQEIDHGDLAVAFLMSAGASEFSSELPEPMDLEGLRYKIYTLTKHDVDSAAQSEARSIFVPRHASRHRPSTFELELTKMTGRAPLTVSDAEAAAAAAALNTTRDAAEMRQRFPPYSPVTVAESTLAARTGAAAHGGGQQHHHQQQQSECLAPHFRQLRLPCLYKDLVDAMQYALDEHVRLVEEKASYARHF